MIKSMTGYGKVTKSFENYDILAEIKSVNSKYFDPSFRMPKSISAMEISLRNPIQEKLQRGKIDIRIELTMKAAVKIPRINPDLFKHYKQVLEDIRTMGEISEPIKIEDYLRLPDIIEFHTDESIEEALESDVLQTVIECVSALEGMRAKEGAALKADLIKRLNNLSDLLGVIDEAKSDIFAYWMEKFTKRCAELELADTFHERIVQEASIFGEKADITEEITRLHSHIKQFSDILKDESAVGKKLDFLSQELNREFNTISSKSTKSQIINSVIEAKAEIDRLREQVQNLV